MAKVALNKNGLAKSAGTLTIYNFDSITGEFTGSADEYLQQGVGLPAYASPVAPPQTDAGSVAIYSNGSWQAVADHRGETAYSTIDGAAVFITVLGEYPAETTTQKPATPWDKWNGEKWVTDQTLEKTAIIKEADEMRAALIAEANAITQAWQTQLRLGMINDTDKASLVAWMKYVQHIQAVDVKEAPAITWPQKPQ